MLELGSIVTLRIILTGVGSPALGAVKGGGSREEGTVKQVAELQEVDKLRVVPPVRIRALTSL